MLSLAQIKALFPRASAAHVKAFAASNAMLFAEHGLGKNPNRLAYFLAQIGHESDGLSIERENLNYGAQRLTQVWPTRFPDEASTTDYVGKPEALGNFVYGGRNGNAAAASGDGFRYRGRGYVQLTGRSGYREVGTLARLDLEGQPDLASQPQNALKVALCFWKWKNANPVCDAGDFRALTLAVNGGTVGFSDRMAWLDKARRVLAPPPPKIEQNAALTVLVQKALRAAGYAAIGTADGALGERTMAAIIDYRMSHGLGIGSIDAALLRALRISYP